MSRACMSPEVERFEFYLRDPFGRVVAMSVSVLCAGIVHDVFLRQVLQICSQIAVGSQASQVVNVGCSFMPRVLGGRLLCVRLWGE